MVMALLLDLANMLGGFLLAVGLVRPGPGLGDGLRQARATLDPFGWVVGVVALVAAGYWLLVHVTSGPHVFHFEVVGLAVGIALLWERLTGRARPGAHDGVDATGIALLLAILGLIAIVVGLQGLFTPDS